MNICSWIFLGLFVVSLSLYLVFYTKKFEIAKRVFVSLLVPELTVLCASILINSLPDSFHVLMVLIFSCLLMGASIIFFIFETSKKARIYARLCFLIYGLIWSELFSSIFYFYHIPAWITVLASLIYILIYLVSMFFMGKQNFNYYLWNFVFFAVNGFFNFCSLLTLVYEPVWYSIFLFLSSLCIIGVSVYYSMSYRKFHFKYQEPVRNLSFVLIHLLICAACTFMLYR